MSGLLLNIGSGQRPFPKPWINVDKQAVWNPDVIWDAGNPMVKCPFDDGSASTIVLHHVLEHFGCGEASNLLRQCHSLLKSSGLLCVYVPDLRELADMWIEGLLSDQVYLTNLYGAYMGDEADRHKWGFTKSSLVATLQASGFSKVRFLTKGLRGLRMSLHGADIAEDRWILGAVACR